MLGQFVFLSICCLQQIVPDYFELIVNLYVQSMVICRLMVSALCFSSICIYRNPAGADIQALFVSNCFWKYQV